MALEPVASNWFVRLGTPHFGDLLTYRGSEIMSESYRCVISGVPYAQQKVRGNIVGCAAWTEAVITATKDLPRLHGPCRVRVTFRLPAIMFPTDYPHGTDIDNLLKRFFDALNVTVFSEVLGRDSCVVAVEAVKVRVTDGRTGADLEIIPS